MQYLGGKFHIGRKLIEAMGLSAGDVVWEPFMGGANMTRWLVEHGCRVTAGDAHPALMSMYDALSNGWTPPDAVSEAEYAQAKSLPDTDPLKAFIGFGCSFGGKWFGGYARNRARNYAEGALRSLARIDWSRVKLAPGDFMQLHRAPPVSTCSFVYCDPPYAGATGYAGTGTFDHDSFWTACSSLSSRGYRVFVSEYTRPMVHHRVVASIDARSSVKRTGAWHGRKELLIEVL